MVMIFFELLCGYGSNDLIGLSILEEEKYDLFLLDHSESNVSKNELIEKLKVIAKGPSCTYDLKLVSYFLKRNFDLELENCFDIISAQTIFGKIQDNPIEESTRINVILNASLYGGNDMSIVPVSILRKEYKKRLIQIKERISDVLDGVKEKSLMAQYKNHFLKISNALGQLEASGFRVDLNERNKLLNSPAYKDHHYKLRELHEITYPVYSIGTSTTGRLGPGSKYGVKFNSLAIPKGRIRQCIIPKNDLLVELDYSSFEIYVMLYLFAPPQIKELFTNKDDVYNIICEKTGIEDRDAVKKIVFQKIYGIGRQVSDFKIKKIFSSMGISERNIYIFKQYFDWVDDVKDDIYKLVIADRNTIADIFGRHITFEDVSTDRKNLFFNNIIQMTAVDIALKALVEIQNCLKDLRSDMILYCHDSYVIDVDKNEIEIIKKISHIMKNSIGDYNLPVKIYAGKNYNDMRYLKNV